MITRQSQALNLIPGTTATTVVHVSQGDVGSRIEFYLYNGSEEYIPSGVTVAVHGTKMNRSNFGPYNVGVVDGTNQIYFNSRAAMTDVAGAAAAEIVITNSSGETVGSANFGILVEPAPYSDGVTYSNDLSTYQRLLNYLSTQEAIMTARMNTFTTLPAGSTSGNAELVDIRVGEDGTTYTNAGTAVRSQVAGLDAKIDALSDSVERTVYKAGGEVSVLMDDYLGDAYGTYQQMALPASVSNGSITVADEGDVFQANSASTARHGYVSVTPGDKYSVTASATAAMATAGIYALVATDNSNIVKRAVQFTNTASGSTTNEIVIPYGATRLWITSSASTDDQFASVVKVNRAEYDSHAYLAEAVGGAYYELRNPVNLATNAVGGMRITGTPKIGDGVTFTENSRTSYSFVAVTAGDHYRVTIRKTTNLGYYVFFTNSGEPPILKGTAITDAGNSLTSFPLTEVVTVPTGASRMYIQSYDNNTTNYLKNVRCEKVVQVKLVDAVSDLNTKVDNKCFATTGFVDISANITAGQLADTTEIGQTLTFSAASNNSYTRLAISPGDTYKITTWASSGYLKHFVVFTNSNDLIVGNAMRGDGTGGEITGIVTAPPSATRMYIMSYMGNSINFLRHTFCETVEIVKNVDLGEWRNRKPSPLECLPPYYTPDWIKTRMDALKANTQSIETGVAFGFITDPHMPSNAKNSQYLIKYILENSSIPYFICGGDIVRAYGTREELEGDADEWLEESNYIGDIFQVRGNHDFIIKTAADVDEGYTESDAYAYDMLFRKQESKVVGAHGKMYYMIDNPTQKVRILCLNPYDIPQAGPIPWNIHTGMPQEEYDWIIDRIKEVEGYTFVIVIHISPDPTGAIPSSGYGAALIEIERAVNQHDVASYSGTVGGEQISISEDFTDTTNVIACNLSGHNHEDVSNVYQDVLSITTTSDACYNNDPNTQRTNMTTTEQAFDVFAIDTTARTIKTVRFGGGVNRSWTY